ncbi:MAG: class I SAM-dependent methyltransferase [Candidatus Omnitrophica bacterium]|nr:class I SAM-dependent methyltransferase [Candidatus Omnitrophota bacterium]
MKSNYVNCNLCGQNNFRILQNDGLFKVVKCKNCGLIYTNPQPEQGRLFEYYDKNSHLLWLEKQSPEEKKSWERRFKKVQKIRVKKIQNFKKAGVLLDVGCGCGYFLNEAKSNGWDVHGVDICESAVGYAKNVFGIDVFKGELKNANFPDNFFDVVTFWHILEHTFDPLGNLVQARRILKPNGILVVATPNVRNYIYKIAYMVFKLKLSGIASQAVRKVHLYHFSVNTLKKIIQKAGFTLLRFDINRDSTLLPERILDTFAWILYKILRINIGIALEVYARKPSDQ